MRAPLLVLFVVVFFPGVFLHSRVTGACPVTTDSIIRVNVRTSSWSSFIMSKLEKEKCAVHMCHTTVPTVVD